jgi:serine/threonine-protein kinase
VRVDEDGLPRRLGRYIVVQHLASGGMGAVYLALQSTRFSGLDRPCVVKTIRATHAASRPHLERFLDEAKTSLLLNHKNLCSTIDVDEADGVVLLAMEHIGGRNLRDLFDRVAADPDALAVDDVVAIAVELLDGLDFAHNLVHPRTGEALGLVHRDISPQNVMVSFAGDVKVIDFGVARSRIQTSQTARGAVVGKLRYMAPEQLGGDAIDRRADVAAVAMILAELLSGVRFFDGVEVDKLIECWFSIEGWRSPALARVPEHLLPVLEHALAVDPRTRFGSAAAFRDALVAVAGAPRAGTLKRTMARLFPGAEDALRTHLQDVYAQAQRFVDDDGRSAFSSSAPSSPSVVASAPSPSPASLVVPTVVDRPTPTAPLAAAATVVTRGTPPVVAPDAQTVVTRPSSSAPVVRPDAQTVVTRPSSSAPAVRSDASAGSSAAVWADGTATATDDARPAAVVDINDASTLRAPGIGASRPLSSGPSSSGPSSSGPSSAHAPTVSASGVEIRAAVEAVLATQVDRQATTTAQVDAAPHEVTTLTSDPVAPARAATERAATMRVDDGDLPPPSTSPRSRRPLGVAAAVACGLLGLVGVFVARVDDPALVTTPTNAPTAAPSTPTNTPSTPTNTPSTPTNTPSTPTAEATTPTKPTKPTNTPTPPTAAPTKPTNTPSPPTTPTNTPSTPTNTPSTPTITDTPVVRPRVDDTRQASPPLSSSSTAGRPRALGERIRWLQGRCGERAPPCRAPLLQRASTLAGLAPADVARLAVDVDECLDACGLPR